MGAKLEAVIALLMVILAIAVLVLPIFVLGPKGVTSLQITEYTLQQVNISTPAISPLSTVLAVGPSEIARYITSGQTYFINNTNISVSVMNEDGSVYKIDPLLFNETFLDAGNYTTVESVPVIVTLNYCSDSAPSGIGGSYTYTTAKNSITAKLNQVKIDLRSICGFSADVNTTKLSELASSSVVDKIYLDQKVEIVLNDSIPIIGADVLWDLSMGGVAINGTGKKIAILDTGLNFSHPDFQGKNITNASFVSPFAASADDGHGHGTHCASIATGTGNASDGKFTGVAPGADLMIGKVLTDDGWGYTSWIISGIEWATDPNGDIDYSDRADVVSMSLGGSSGSGNDPISLAVDQAVDMGSVIVVAAGNEGVYGYGTVSSPGVSRRAITVGASNKNDTIASFSSIGPTADGRLKPEIVAPGRSICAAKAGYLSNNNCSNDYYGMLSGTSMATPHVAGAAALLLQVHPDWTSEQIKSALVLTAIDLNESVFKQGSGRIDLVRAISVPLLTYPAVVDVVPDDELTASAYLTIQNINGTDLEVNLSTTNVLDDNGTSNNWAQVNETNFLIPANGNHTVKITISFPDLTEGYYYGYLNIGISNSSYHVPFANARFSRLTVGAKWENGTLLQPSFIVISDINNQSILFVENGGSDSFNKNYTFVLKSGNYSVHVFGDYDDWSLNYILGETLTINPAEIKEAIYSLDAAKKVNVPMKSFDGRQLDLYDYRYMVVCGFPVYPYRLRMADGFLDMGIHLPETLYVSGHTCENRSLEINVVGFPTRGYTYQTNTKADWDDMTGQEWMWRWENRDISDEAYYGGWRIDGDLNNDISLSFSDNTTIFTQFFNFIAYAPYTGTRNPQYSMSRISFWFAPDWFFELSPWLRVAPPTNRTIYLSADNWSYGDYFQNNYVGNDFFWAYSQTEHPEPYSSGIPIVRTAPFNITHYFGTAPYQLPYFENDGSWGNRFIIAVHAPLVQTYNRSAFVSKDYGIYPPTIDVYHEGSRIYNNTLYSGWTAPFTYDVPVIPGYSYCGDYHVNMTIPLLYNYYNNITVSQDFNYPCDPADINPPKALAFYIPPGFNYSEPLPVSMSFDEAPTQVKITALTDSGWIAANGTITGTNYAGTIIFADNTTKTIDLQINASDVRYNNISYLIPKVSVLQRNITINLFTNNSDVMPGDTILVSGNVSDPLDVNFSGIKLKYFLGSQYVDFDRADFEENLNEFYFGFPDYQMHMGHFEKELTIPKTIDGDLNVSVLFEGSGAYNQIVSYISLNVTYPFEANIPETTKTIVSDVSSSFVLKIKNKMAVSDTYNLTLGDVGAWRVNFDADSFTLAPEAERDVYLSVTPIISAPMSKNIQFNITDSNQGYIKDMQVSVTAVMPNVAPPTGGLSGGGGAPPAASSITFETTESGISVNMKNLKAGIPYKVNESWTTDMTLAGITPTDNIKNAQISLTQTQATIQPDGFVYQTFEISTSANLSKLDIKFRVSKTWIAENNLNKDMVKLARETDKVLEPVPTTLVEEDADYYYYSAEINHLSKFSIVILNKTEFTDLMHSISNYYDGRSTFIDVIDILSSYYTV